MAHHAKVPFLGRIPLDPELATAAENGVKFADRLEKSKTAESLGLIVDKLL